MPNTDTQFLERNKCRGFSQLLSYTEVVFAFLQSNGMYFEKHQLTSPRRRSSPRQTMRRGMCCMFTYKCGASVEKYDELELLLHESEHGATESAFGS